MSLWGKIRRMFAAAPDPAPALILTKLAEAQANDAKVAIANGFKYTSDPVAWVAAGGSIAAWRFAVMRVNGTLWGKVNPVIGYFLGDTTPADVPATTVGNTLQLTPHANGWFDES